MPKKLTTFNKSILKEQSKRKRERERERERARAAATMALKKKKERLVDRPDALHDVNVVKNKQKRNEVVKKIKKKRKAEKKVEKEKRHKLLKEQGLPLPKPETIDSKRTPDVTFVEDENDPEVVEDERNDEFAELLASEEAPNLLMTTCPKPSKATHMFAKELECVFPFSVYKKRKETTLVSEVVEYAKQQGHTAVMIINEDVKKVKREKTHTHTHTLERGEEEKSSNSLF